MTRWGLGTAVHIKKERTICTTMIQGAKDNGLFDKVVIMKLFW